ncbi:MAG: hypothetical protein CALGDGBN_02969 [Pseudomonadales bacterium]|nr:hypothetical protein [Pseudomonadales bacterium]
MSAENEDDDNLDSEAVEAEAEAEASAEPGPREEPVEVPSSESRRKLRDQLEAEIQAFLAAGGSIKQVEPNASARPPIITASVNDEVV